MLRVVFQVSKSEGRQKLMEDFLTDFVWFWSRLELLCVYIWNKKKITIIIFVTREDGSKRTKILEEARKTQIHKKSQHKMMRFLILEYKRRVLSIKKASSPELRSHLVDSVAYPPIFSFAKSEYHWATFTVSLQVSVADNTTCRYFAWLVWCIIFIAFKRVL